MSKKTELLHFENLNELAYFSNNVNCLRRYAFIDWINSTDTHTFFKNHFVHEVYSEHHQKGDTYKKHLDQCKLPTISEEQFQKMTVSMLFMKKEILKKGYTLEDIENNQNVSHHHLPFIHTEQQILDMYVRVCK